MSSAGGMSVVPSGGTWMIIGAVQGSGKLPNGRYVAGWEVAYQLDTGQAATVFVPADSFTLDNVKKVVATAAAQLRAVVNMSGAG